ncbi:MAG: 4Fe-4S binding protein [Clostridiales bacterium]|uniref:4Fe-4S binding protein n=1 Tax=Candidatus Pullilachnospira stercoravium TaxID=2840913 RepID=A0A9D1T646_9FIRM|nr:4Fe-4S binding protein [Clostridiales bacterium]HIV12464.1 4Fe-4S binding protein [Candidatus Pullilachnospira stercoravium]
MAALTISPEEEKRVKALGFLNNKGTDNFSGRIITVNGKVTARQQKVIAEAAEKFGNGTVTYTTRLTVEVPGIPFDKIEEFQEFIAKEGLITGGTGSVVRPVVSCKGTTCQYGLIDTFDLSQKIHERFYLGYHTVKLPHKFKIAVGGCPNNCVKPDLNDLGIIGQLIPDYDEDACNGCRKCSVVTACPMGAASLADGVMEIDPEVCNHCGRCVGKCRFDAIEGGTRGYKVYIGGRWGKKVAQGRTLSRIFRTEEEVLDVVEKAILLFREQGMTGERFSQTIDRLGFENVEKQLLANDLLERKQEILDATLHVTGGASC